MVMTQKVELLDFGSLSADDVANWARLQASDPSLASPYFSPNYAAAANAARPGVKVMLFSDAEGAIAYWPHRPGPLGTARPIGGPMDDLHGIIAAPGTVLDLSRREVTRHIGGYAFSAVPAQQRRHGIAGQWGAGNQVMDLSSGYEGWLEERQDASSNFRREYRKVEKLLEDTATEVRHDVVDDAAFDRMIELKRDAYRQSGHFDLFQLGWPRRMLEALLEGRGAGARGVLSTLHIGGDLAAITYCMRSPSVLHYWFPAYEEAFSKQKPGLALLVSLAQWAAGEGIGELHLGLGETQYKRQMASWMAPVRGGAFALGGAQKLATSCTEVSLRIEGSSRLLDIPAKYARKYDRAVLAGSWRA